MPRDTTALGTDYAIVRTFHNVPPLQTVEAPRFTAHAFIGGVLLLIAGLGAIALLILFIEPPAASPDAIAPASSGTPPSHASSVSAHGQPGSH